MEKKENKPKTIKQEETIWDSIKSIFILFLMSPIIIVGFIVVFVMVIAEGKNWKKCDYWRVCPMYNPDSPCCSEDMGMYSEYDKPAGCYVQVSDRIKELKKQGKVLRRLR